ncbi:MAG: sulfur carrier protein ThiS [Tannerellaceae bacterium]|nr:sulfur carrier protein ThiS [Tannerellaceae bacterium]
MIIKLNDKPYEVKEGTSLLAFLEKLEIKKEGVAVAVNYQVIPKTQWESTILSAGQDLMLIHAVSGG